MTSLGDTELKQVDSSKSLETPYYLLPSPPPNIHMQYTALSGGGLEGSSIL